MFPPEKESGLGEKELAFEVGISLDKEQPPPCSFMSILASFKKHSR